MDLDEAVTRLTSLTLILDDTDITQAVHDLARSALAVVPSCLAVLITLGDSTPLAAVTPRYREGVAQVRATLRLDFTGHHRMVYVAEEEGAFAQFAGLTLPMHPQGSALFGAAPAGHQLQAIVIDGDLMPENGAPWQLLGAHALDSTINRAVGFLMDRGFEPEDALQELRIRSQRSGRSLTITSERVLQSID